MARPTRAQSGRSDVQLAKRRHTWKDDDVMTGYTRSMTQLFSRKFNIRYGTQTESAPPAGH
eukprot:5907149-Prymnesium_polylepis.1